MKPKIFVHGSYVGNTGYNNHTRDFFRELSKHVQLKVRNFTVGDSWAGYSETCHDGEKYLTDLDKSLLYQQILWTGNGNRDNFSLYPSTEKEFQPDFNIILNETNHHLFWDIYSGPKIAYNVWESTRQPDNFFNRLMQFDELWVPTEWQKKCTIEQGYDPEKIKVVPEGVDILTFFPQTVEPLEEYKDGRFKFLLFGRWDYRKSTKEIIETFLKTFDPSEPVDLVVSIDNMWGEEMDGIKTTEERLEHYGLIDSRIKIKHFPTREEYIKYMKLGHVFLSCARSEGWNLPLIEAMACGTPSIYSNCSGQLEFAEGRGIPVKVIGEKPANLNNYGSYSMTSGVAGNYYEPDFDDLSTQMRIVYQNYDSYKRKAIEESIDIRQKFNWEQIGKIGHQKVMDFYEKTKDPNFFKNKKNKVSVSYIDGPKVEIIGEVPERYLVEFVDQDTNKVVFSDTISNNMWTLCSTKYYKNWEIRINGVTFEKFNLQGKRVLISFESKSIGDTIAWAPYAVEFANKHKCKVILSTFHNKFFEGLESYKDIEFVSPGSTVNCYALYRIGWIRNSNGKWDKLDCYPQILNTLPLQQTATDILGLKYYEMNHGINFKPQKKPINAKYIVFAPQSTTGCKEWVYENWVELSRKLRDFGYQIVVLSSTPFQIDGCRNVCGKELNEVINYIFHADLFIGLSSGLSWINWAMGKKTVMIAGFTESFHEFKYNNIRISNEVCIKCWCDTEFVFDAGDWNWCPVYKGTKKQHICQKSITVDQVFSKLPL